MKEFKKIIFTFKGLMLELLPGKILLEIKKSHYLRFLKQANKEIEPDFMGVANLVKKGDVVIDIGANVGCYTKLLSDLVAEAGEVYSIEPISETFTILSYCVKKMGLGNVKLFNLALSDKESSAFMAVPKYDFGGYNFYQSKLVNNDKQRMDCKYFPVKIKSLDSIVDISKKRISFIKCDVEGHELAVIKGSHKIIINAKPNWLIEVSSDPDKPGTQAWDLFEIMRKHGYSVYWYDGKKFYRRAKGDNSVNYFFISDDHVNEIISFTG